MDKVATLAIQDRRELFQHKIEFYYSSWAKYDLAVPGSIHLVPKQERMEELARDYASMQVMLFGDAPAFDAILRALADLEAEINGTRQPTSG